MAHRNNVRYNVLLRRAGPGSLASPSPIPISNPARFPSRCFLQTATSVFLATVEFGIIRRNSFDQAIV
jgi:hypothetical protein